LRRWAAGGLSHQLRQGAVPGARVLHHLRAHGRDPGRPPDRSVWRPMRSVLGLTAAALALGLSPLALTSYQLGLLTKMLILAIFAMSLNLILGYGGAAALGRARSLLLAALTVGLD